MPADNDALMAAAPAPTYKKSLTPPDLGVIRCVLELGADVNAKTDSGGLPLNAAIALNADDTPKAIARSKVAEALRKIFVPDVFHAKDHESGGTLDRELLFERLEKRRPVFR